MLLKQRFHGDFTDKFGPYSVRTTPYYLAQNYGPYCIRVMNGPYLSVFDNITPVIGIPLSLRIVVINGCKDAVSYPFSILSILRNDWLVDEWIHQIRNARDFKNPFFFIYSFI